MTPEKRNVIYCDASKRRGAVAASVVIMCDDHLVDTWTTALPASLDSTSAEVEALKLAIERAEALPSPTLVLSDSRSALETVAKRRGIRLRGASAFEVASGRRVGWISKRDGHPGHVEAHNAATHESLRISSQRRPR